MAKAKAKASELTDDLVEQVMGDRYLAPAGAKPSKRLAHARTRLARVRAPINDGKQWYLLSTIADTPRKAELLIEASRSQGRVHHGHPPINIELYYPYERIMRPIPRKLLSHKQRADSALVVPQRPVNISLFPGYVFAEFDYNGDPWRGLFDMSGIVGIACEEGKPLPLRAGFVEGLRALEVDGAVPGDTLLKALPVDLGEEVRVTFGPFAGHNGTIEELPDVVLADLDESAKVKLLVRAFGGLVRVELPITDIGKL